MHQIHISVFHMFSGGESQNSWKTKMVIGDALPPEKNNLTTQLGLYTIVISWGKVALNGFLLFLQWSKRERERKRKKNIKSYDCAATILIWFLCTYNKRTEIFVHVIKWHISTTWIRKRKTVILRGTVIQFCIQRFIREK